MARVRVQAANFPRAAWDSAIRRIAPDCTQGATERELVAAELSEFYGIGCRHRPEARAAGMNSARER